MQEPALHFAHSDAQTGQQRACMQVTSSSKVLQKDSPVGPGYYSNLPSAFDSVLKKPASKFYGES